MVGEGAAIELLARYFKQERMNGITAIMELLAATYAVQFSTAYLKTPKHQ